MLYTKSFDEAMTCCDLPRDLTVTSVSFRAFQLLCVILFSAFKEWQSLYQWIWIWYSDAPHYGWDTRSVFCCVCLFISVVSSQKDFCPVGFLPVCQSVSPVSLPVRKSPAGVAASLSVVSCMPVVWGISRCPGGCHFTSFPPPAQQECSSVKATVVR